MTKVAFIGLGSMGAPQAHLLARAGHDLSVFDPYPAAFEAFRDIARLATSPRDAAEGVEFACVCVRDDQQVLDVVLGEDGLVSGLAAGSNVLIHSTIRTDTVARLNEVLRGRGIALVDAPVSRTRRTDDEPFVFTMMGGSSEDVEKARAVVAAFSTEADHIGPLGAGMATKIANNLVTWVQIIIGAQAAGIATTNGVPYEKLRKVMQSNGNLTPTMGAMLDGKFQSLEPNPQRDAFLASQAGIGEKDLTLAIETADMSGVDTMMMAQALRVVRSIMTASPSPVR